jgi:catechol O-methyltransferase
MSNKLTYLLSLAKAATRKGETDDAIKERLVERVLSTAPEGDVDAAIKVIDVFGSKTSFLMNVGDEKGKLLDGVIERIRPKNALELGAFCGYSGLRIARKLPKGGRLFSLEINAANASVATRVWEHAGVADRVQAVVGSLDDGRTIGRLTSEFDLAPGALDFVFVDHEHSRYLPDLMLLLDSGLLHNGTVVLADNVKTPGAPKYRAYMREQQDDLWHTVEHKAHLEYQSFIPDLVLESTYLGPSRGSLSPVAARTESILDRS